MWLLFFFFFKQKTAYEMRISDWSSDVCSSDLEAQEIIAQNDYRPSNPQIAAKYASQFPKLDLVTIRDFGGWAKAQPEYFGDGGVFDQIYKKQAAPHVNGGRWHQPPARPLSRGRSARESPTPQIGRAWWRDRVVQCGKNAWR